MNIRSRNKVDATFNMSSLSDVIFLLLIFFMLTSTIVSPNAIKLLLPKANGQTRSPQTVVVSVTEDLRYYVGQKEVSFDQLSGEIAANLEKYKEANPEPAVKLRFAKTLTIQDLVSVMKLGTEMKVRMILETKPE